MCTGDQLELRGHTALHFETIVGHAHIRLTNTGHAPAGSKHEHEMHELPSVTNEDW